MYHFVILANESTDEHEVWVNACKDYPGKVSWRVVDLTRDTWLEEIRKGPVDYLLAKPGGTLEHFKLLYDERLRILADELGYPVYPPLPEIYIYENKRYFSFWLKAKEIPHPETHVFYHRDEALQFADHAPLPIVAKLNIGASGNGVVILKDRSSAADYVHKIFGEGVGSRTGPRMDKGKLLQRAVHMLMNPAKLKARLSKYKSVAANPQKGFCIFQEFIPHSFEWRVVRIGDSFFAHKKMVKGEKASGSLIKGYENPPLSLFDFSKEVTDKVQFRSQALDIFETADGRYLVNEMQCIFGQSDPYQMLVDGKPGRYIHDGSQWVFEEGMFNQNESFNLRIEDIFYLAGNK